MVQMKLAIAAASVAGIASAAPVTERQASTNIDTTVLQFALTLEHLENVFYKQALKKFSLQDFQKAGYSADYYNNLNYIAYDEEQHVKLLTSAIQANGVTPVAACTYNFPYVDVPSFITLSSILEGVGTSAYLGGAPLITSKQYLTVAGSILVTEALHTSMQREAIGEVPMANPYGTPLDPTSVYTLAAMFIASCPKSNPSLPFVPYPTLNVNGMVCTCEEPYCGNPSQYVKRGGWWHKSWNGQWGSQSKNCKPAAAGSTVSFTAASKVPAGSYVTFVSGLSVISVPAKCNGKGVSAQVPAGVSGQTYAFITSMDNEMTLNGTSILFGPAIVEVSPPPPTLDYSVLK